MMGEDSPNGRSNKSKPRHPKTTVEMVENNNSAPARGGAGAECD